MIVPVFTARCTLVQSAVLRLHDVRPSVRPSVTLLDQDHIGWKSWKLIARKQPNTFALRSPKAIHLLSWEHREILGDYIEVGWEKRRVGAQKRQYL